MNYSKEAPPVNRIWQAEVALAAVVFIEKASSTITMQVPQPTPSRLWMNPAARAPRTTYLNCLSSSRLISCSIQQSLQVANSFLNLILSRQTQPAVMPIKISRPSGQSREHLSTEQKGRFPCSRKARNQNPMKSTKLRRMSFTWCDCSQVSRALFATSQSLPGKWLPTGAQQTTTTASVPLSVSSSSEMRVQLFSDSAGQSCVCLVGAFLNLAQKLKVKQEKTKTSRLSWAALGRNSSVMAPRVEPRRLQGMMISRRGQLTREVLPFGCRLRMTEMKLGRAEPTTMAWARAVAQLSQQFRAMTRISILKRPMELPQTLTRAAATPVSRQTSIVYMERGKMSLCWQTPNRHSSMNQQSALLRQVYNSMIVISIEGGGEEVEEDELE